MNYRHYFAIEKQLTKAGYEVTRQELISDFTNGAKKGLSDLSHIEYAEFISYLRTTYSSILSGEKVSKSKSIKTAVHYLCLMGYVTSANRPDIDRINEYIRNIGSNNPRKVVLPALTPGELNRVVTQIKARYQKEIAQ